MNATGRDDTAKLLQSSNDDDLVTAGRLLDDLRAVRNRADYDMRREDVERANTAKANVQIAAEVIQTIDSFLTDETHKNSAIPHIRKHHDFIKGTK